MRSVLAFAAIALIALFLACVNDPTPLIGGGQDPANTWAGATACLPNARATACTRESRPVCARRANGERRTYSNGCEACLDPSVEDHRPGACRIP